MTPSAENSPTYRSIARECGLGHSTVARALSGHPHVAQKTRERVLQVAERLGYRPDPSLTALSRRRWPSGPRARTVTLAWVYFSEKGRPPRRLRAEAEAAEQRAAELGYAMDFFDVNALGSGRRLNEVLLARGIRGVLVQAFKESSALEMEWERFCTVFVGPENDEIHTHNVQADFRATVRMSVAECLARGYQRPAFALMDYEASGTSEPIYAQVLAERERLSQRFGSQPKIFDWHPAKPEEVAAAHRWLRESGADCLITSHAGLYFWLTNPCFYGCGEFSPLRIPYDVPMVSLREEPSIPGLAHTSLREREQGKEAVNLVHRHLQQGMLGSPSVPMRMLVPPLFVPGPTLPDREAAEAGKPRARGGQVPRVLPKSSM